METELILHDNISADTLANGETFDLEYKATNGKEVYGLFEQFKTDGLDMSKLDHL